MSIHPSWFDEVWNKGNEKAIAEMVQPDAIAHGLIMPHGSDARGLREFTEFWRTMRSAFSEIHISVENTVCEGDFEVARLLITGRHTGDGLPFPPKGIPVRFTGMSMVRLKDGKIAESWNNVDFMTMFQQIQGLPQPPA